MDVSPGAATTGAAKWVTLTKTFCLALLQGRKLRLVVRGAVTIADLINDAGALRLFRGLTA